MASGKSTLSIKLAKEHHAILLSEDELLSSLYPDDIHTIQDYVKCSNRLKNTLLSHIKDLLVNNNVVLDFPANTKKQREWFRDIIEATKVAHTLHYVDKPDTVCKHQLKLRSKDKPIGTPFTNDAEFDMITQYFQEPSEDENFNIVTYREETSDKS